MEVDWMSPVGEVYYLPQPSIKIIPGSRVEQVLQKAESIAAREAAMAKAVLDGKSIVEVMGTNYETMLERK
jgi:4-hydroxy-4-methyl-2-oxoglutarate aldolase